MRTTSSLEGFNSQLGRKFARKGNFFKFVVNLSEVEFVEGRKMSQMVASGGSASVFRENKRDITIRSAMTNLKDTKITMIEFLNRVTYKENNISMAMANYYVPDGYVSDNEAEVFEECPPPVVRVNQTNLNIDDMLCVVCKDSKANVVYFPCRDMKCCQQCSSLIAAQHEGAFPCPNCRQPVIDTVVVFV